MQAGCPGAGALPWGMAAGPPRLLPGEASALLKGGPEFRCCRLPAGLQPAGWVPGGAEEARAEVRCPARGRMQVEEGRGGRGGLWFGVSLISCVVAAGSAGVGGKRDAQSLLRAWPARLVPSVTSVLRGHCIPGHQTRRQEEEKPCSGLKKWGCTHLQQGEFHPRVFGCSGHSTALRAPSGTGLWQPTKPWCDLHAHTPTPLG